MKTYTGTMYYYDQNGERVPLPFQVKCGSRVSAVEQMLVKASLRGMRQANVCISRGQK